MHTEKMMNYVKASGADALLLLDEADMHYVCGFSPSEGMILVTPTAVFQLVDSRYTETARLHAADTGVHVTEITTGFWDELDALLEKIDCKILLFEDRTIAYRQYTQLQGIFSGELRPVGNGVMDLRNVKEPWEIDLMKTANRIAEKAFLELLNDVKPGKTEKELAARFDYLMALGGSDGVSFDTILLTGAHTSMPHGVPENREVQKGDFVLFDFGATYRGYHSDMTRTVAVGSATAEMQAAYDLVLRAQLAGIQALHAGVTCKEVYQAANEVLAAEDKAQYFRHSLGHGVGLEIHEGYNASPRSVDVYQTGNVTSMEPGIYLPDKFGIRIEDVLYLSPHGRENLSNVTKKLIVL